MGVSEEETDLSEITILPDGRVYVLGASDRLLEALAVLNPNDAALGQRLKQVRGLACGLEHEAQAARGSRVGEGSIFRTLPQEAEP